MDPDTLTHPRGVGGFLCNKKPPPHYYEVEITGDLMAVTMCRLGLDSELKVHDGTPSAPRLAGQYLIFP